MKIYCEMCERHFQIGVMKGNFELQRMEIMQRASEDLIDELRDKNRVLNDNIKLLEENKALLERSLKDLQLKVPLQRATSEEPEKPRSGANKAMRTYSTVIQSSEKNVSNSISNKQLSPSVTNLIAAQNATMNKLINLAGESENNAQPNKKPPTNSLDEEGFQIVTGKKRNQARRKMPETKIATGKNLKKSDKIAGAIRRKWIYVGRIAGRDVSEKDIGDYLSDLKGFEKYENISIKKLDTLGNNSAFCIGLPTEELYAKVFSVDYWNEGVSLREYDLRRSFLAQRNQMKNVIGSN